MNSQRRRRRARGNSIVSRASGPNDLDSGLAMQTPFLHWQILTFAVCVPPEPCRSVTSRGTLCSPVGSSFICCNVAAVSKEERGVNVTTGYYNKRIVMPKEMGAWANIVRKKLVSSVHTFHVVVSHCFALFQHTSSQGVTNIPTVQ